jgi:hypothetical protein
MPQQEQVPQALEKRFWVKVDKRGDDECWPWLAGKSKGYGNFSRDGKDAKAYRVSYELLVGPIPPGRDLDHLCRNRACVNPAHLEPVSRRENILRGIGPSAQRAKQTHCVHGHPFDGENTMYLVGKNGQKHRRCRACGLKKAQEEARKEREERQARAKERPPKPIDPAYWKWAESPAAKGAKTHCKRGHEFTPENTRMNHRGHRECRACKRILGEQRRAKTKGEQNAAA